MKFCSSSDREFSVSSGSDSKDDAVVLVSALDQIDGASVVLLVSSGSLYDSEVAVVCLIELSPRCWPQIGQKSGVKEEFEAPHSQSQPKNPE